MNVRDRVGTAECPQCRQVIHVAAGALRREGGRSILPISLDPHDCRPHGGGEPMVWLEAA